MKNIYFATVALAALSFTACSDDKDSGSVGSCYYTETAGISGYNYCADGITSAECKAAGEQLSGLYTLKAMDSCPKDEDLKCEVQGTVIYYYGEIIKTAGFTCASLGGK